MLEKLPAKSLGNCWETAEEMAEKTPAEWLKNAVQNARDSRDWDTVRAAVITSKQRRKENDHGTL